MSDRDTKLIHQSRSTRLSFPDNEAKQAWLPLLFGAYAIVDAGVNEAIRREEKQGSTLACHKGCAACCRSHTTIPIYPLELIGINWYAVEKISGPVREQLKTQLHDHKKAILVHCCLKNACVVHPLRPMACRQFNVFDTVCVEGEDANHTRRQDVLTPIRDYADEAFDVLLPFYDIKKECCAQTHDPERRSASTGQGVARVRLAEACGAHASA